MLTNWNEETSIFSSSHAVATRALRLDVFGEDDKRLSRASGFLIDDPDGLHLYTCWHVVSGVDYPPPHPLEPPKKRSYIEVFTQAVVQRQPGVVAIHDKTSTRVELYEDDRPIWKQDPNIRSNPDLEAIGLPLPKFFDLVRIPIRLDALIVDSCAFKPENLMYEGVDIGNLVAIVGFPYGFSGKGLGTPEPVFLTRGIASSGNGMDEPYGPKFRLLDGAGDRSMSGSPILIFHQNRWQLYGMYTDFLYPDAQHGHAIKDRHSALGLMHEIVLARDFMGVGNS